MHDFGSMSSIYIPSVEVLLNPKLLSYIRTKFNQVQITIKGNTIVIIICEFLSQSESEQEPEEAANPPPAKRLRSDELTRVIVVLPEGERHQMDISQDSTLKVGNVKTKTK